MMSRGLMVELEQVSDGGAGAAALVELCRVVGRGRRAVGQATCPAPRWPRPWCWRCTCRRRRRRRGRRGARCRGAARRRCAGDVLAVALEGGDDVERVARCVVPGADRAAVDHERGAVQPAHGHQAAGHVLVAAGERDVGVVPLGAHHRLDRVGDQVARLQRVAHALGAHRDAVGHADGVEAHADQAGRDRRLPSPAAARSFRCMLQVLPSYHTLAMPTWALSMSSAVRPVA